MHDSFSEHQRVEGPSDRSFGLTVGGILAAIGVVRWFAFGAGAGSTTVLLTLGLGLVAFAVAAPRLLATPNRMWMKLGHLLARIVNPVVMLAMFVLIFVPVALVMRVFRRDALRLRRSRERDSYWIDRDPPGPEPETIVHQF